jgi:hypothetical protein
MLFRMAKRAGKMASSLPFPVVKSVWIDCITLEKQQC